MTLTREQFIERAMEAHNGKYTYDKVVYVGQLSKVIITCPIHGDFEQTPASHTKPKAGRAHAQGCPKCKADKAAVAHQSTTSEFIEKAKQVHGDKYDYSKVEYVHARKQIIIICPEHGEFKQTPNDHLSGKGCSGCMKCGYNQAKTGHLYFLISADKKLAKVGITNNMTQRMKQLKKSTPFEFYHVHTFTNADGSLARYFEKLFHEKYTSANLKNFDGSTEWMEYTSEMEYEFETLLK